MRWIQDQSRWRSPTPTPTIHHAHQSKTSALGQRRGREVTRVSWFEDSDLAVWVGRCAPERMTMTMTTPTTQRTRMAQKHLLQGIVKSKHFGTPKKQSSAKDVHSLLCIFTLHLHKPMFVPWQTMTDHLAMRCSYLEQQWHCSDDSLTVIYSDEPKCDFTKK